MRRSATFSDATCALMSPQFRSGMRQLRRMSSSALVELALRKSFLGGSRIPSWKIS